METTLKNIVIIKIGTNILTTPGRKLDLNNLQNLVDQISSEFCKKKHKFIIVTSGAITCGSEQLGFFAQSIPEKQAAAAIGQILLMKEYAQFFGQKGICIGQILLTKDCLKNAVMFKNAHNTIMKMLEKNVIPIINENDSIATDEIDARFGDNDELSCHVAQMVKAKLLILLTDIDGLYTSNPKLDPTAKLLKSINGANQKIFACIQDEDNGRSRGGMKSKLNSACRAAQAGIKAIIANGRRENIIQAIFTNKFIGTKITKGAIK